MMRMFLAAGVAVWVALCGASAQDLSALARLDPQSSSIGDTGQGIAVSLALSQPVPWRLRVLDAPPRLVLDVREVDWSGIGQVSRGSARVTELRAGVFRPGWSRLVMEMTGPFLVDQAEMRTTEGSARLVLRLEPASQGAFAAKAALPEPEEWAPPTAADLPKPGSFLTTEDFGVPVLVTRDSGGKVRAFLNACRHRGVMVETAEKGEKSRFSCPFHAWTYDATGALIGVPMEDHFGAIDRSCLGLIELPALEQYGFIMVHPDPKGVIDPDVVFEGIAPDLENWDWGRYELGFAQTLDMKMNWKLATDTFGETYHFKRLHRDTLANNFHGDVLSYRTYERNHRMILCLKGIDDLRGQPEADWRIETGGFPVYFLFPNVVINVGNQRIAVVRVYPHPDDPGRSVSQISYYFDPEVLAENPEFAIAFSEGFTRVVAAEDYATGALLKATFAVRFKAAMDEDFGTPDAVAVLFDLASEVNRTRPGA